MANHSQKHLKHNLLDQVEAARRRLMDAISTADQRLSTGDDLTEIEQDVNLALSKFDRDCRVAVDTYLACAAANALSKRQ